MVDTGACYGVRSTAYCSEPRQLERARQRTGSEANDLRAFDSHATGVGLASDLRSVADGLFPQQTRAEFLASCWPSNCFSDPPGPGRRCKVVVKTPGPNQSAWLANSFGPRTGPASPPTCAFPFPAATSARSSNTAGRRIPRGRPGVPPTWSADCLDSCPNWWQATAPPCWPAGSKGAPQALDGAALATGSGDCRFLDAPQPLSPGLEIGLAAGP